MMLTMRTLTNESLQQIGNSVTLMGWVQTRRDHGKLIFIDLRDRWGIVQVVFSPKNAELLKEADRLRPEWVVSIEGKVKKRPENMENPELETGSIEIEAEKLTILNESKTPPFAIDSDGYEIGEEHRMRYRYLDLRRGRMKNNIILRDRIFSFIRDYLHKKDFIEIETPILTKSTPEGARDYVVPSRLYPGRFYALPQSPQQYKQLLMVAGLERYFQIARCFRDEDTRHDRQPEFTQLDLETNFSSEEDILNLIEALFVELVGKILPVKKIAANPFPRISYRDALEKYKTDKPDLRTNKDDPNEVAFLWITDFPLFEYSKTEKRYVSMHHPFTAPVEEDLALVDSKPEKVRSQAYDLVLNGSEIGGGSIRIHTRELQEKIFRALKLPEDEIKSRFKHLLEAFEFGAPPHGGIAVGLDRALAVLLNEPSVREVITFPKTGDAQDLMMESPSEIDKKQLDELHIQIKKAR